VKSGYEEKNTKGNRFTDKILKEQNLKNES
jgi:hypothetical protein